MRKMTKAGLMRAAAEVTDLLYEIELNLQTKEEGVRGTDLFTRDVTIGFDGAGNAILENTVDIAKTDASGHERIKMQIRMNAIHEKAQTLAKAFHSMLPGIPLTWKLDIVHQDKNRHILQLGRRTNNSFAVKTKIDVIDTVLARWKSPLARLAQYFQSTYTTTPERLWVVGKNDMLNGNTGLCGRLTTLEIPAHDLTQAFKHFTFSTQQHVATPAPQTEDTAIFLEIDTPHDPIDTNQLNSEQENALLKATQNPLASGVGQKAEELAVIIAENLRKLSTGSKSLITLDLLNGTSNTLFKNHSCAAPQDIEAEQPIREEIKSLTLTLAQELQDFLSSYHPKMRQGFLEIKSGATFSSNPTQWHWHVDIDGYKTTTSPYNLKSIADASYVLDACNINDTLTLYGVCKPRPEWQTDVNLESEMYLMRASTPQHAWAVLTAPKSGVVKQVNPTVMHILNPELEASKAQARETTYTAIKKVYKK